jgi:hypothetical protein
LRAMASGVSSASSRRGSPVAGFTIVRTRPPRGGPGGEA